MEPDVRIEPGRGVYDTRRASALSGVPLRTLHYWAQNGIYLPTIDPEPRTRLWSWGDLLAVRAIHWFRHGGRDGHEARPVSMPKIRAMLRTIEEIGQSRELLHRLVAVSEDGDLHLRLGDDQIMRADRTGQLVMPDMVRLVTPYGSGPDLLYPRDHLRIIPGKLHGEPHVKDTRISTAVLFRLHEMGYLVGDILEMYPDVSPAALHDALDLERPLQPAA
ncbi:MAG: DUF433 domain-containing protein [Chloroflexota bacterium]|nr:DUF433 domain-containing protein [Chloroflexota bacterium]